MTEQASFAISAMPLSIVPADRLSVIFRRLLHGGDARGKVRGRVLVRVEQVRLPLLGVPEERRAAIDQTHETGALVTTDSKERVVALQYVQVEQPLIEEIHLAT